MHEGESSYVPPRPPSQSPEEGGYGGEDVITIDEAIERVGYGKFQLRVMIAGGLCFAADAMEVLLLSFLVVVLQALWNISAKQAAILTSIVFLGAMLGTLILGPMGDHYGRRPMFLVSSIIIAVFGFTTAICTSFVPLVITRFLVGFGVGGLIIPFDILAEMLPIHHRGRDLLFIEYFWTFGTMLVPVVAILTIGNETADVHSNTNGWRIFVALCAIPCVISTAIGYWLVPESPRWLVGIGQPDKALEVLREGAKANGKDPYVAFPAYIRIQHEEPEATNVKDLFTPRWRWITLRLWMVWACFAFLYYGIIIATTFIFSETSDDPTQSDAYFFDYGAIFASCSAEIFGTTLTLFFVDRVGRIPLQSSSYVLGGVSAIILAVIATQNPDGRSALITLAFFTRLFFHAANITTWVGTAEILTTEIRNTGHAAANAWARLGGFLSPYLVKESTNKMVVGGTMLGVALLAAVCAWGLPETKNHALGVHPDEEKKKRELQLQSQVPDKDIN